MNRYNNGKCYKLVNTEDGEIYVGSTCMPLAKRKHDHKKRAAKTPNRRVYAHLNEVGWANVRIILLEECCVDNMDQLRACEQRWVDELEPSLNSRAAYVPPCPHGHIKYACKDCGGASICDHGRRKVVCKQCGGVGICKHSKQRSQCKQCGGSSICEHGLFKLQCKDCLGDKYYCYECCSNFATRSSLAYHMGSKKHAKRYAELVAE